jgi:hypothetical protein
MPILFEIYSMCWIKTKEADIACASTGTDRKEFVENINWRHFKYFMHVNIIILLLVVVVYVLNKD